MTPTLCLVGRTALVSLRKKGPAASRPEAREVTVAFPSRWTKGKLLAYCRQEHPEDAVRILEWRPVSAIGGGWEPTLWIANPAAFLDFHYGVLR